MIAEEERLRSPWPFKAARGQQGGARSSDGPNASQREVSNEDDLVQTQSGKRSP